MIQGTARGSNWRTVLVNFNNDRISRGVQQAGCIAMLPTLINGKLQPLVVLYSLITSTSFDEAFEEAALSFCTVHKLENNDCNLMANAARDQARHQILFVQPACIAARHERHRAVGAGEETGVSVDPQQQMVYGTAWKKNRTSMLTLRALQEGFRAIDTACQPKHYAEKDVGQAVAAFLQGAPLARREDIYLQTKFTPIDGQDLNQPVPYNEEAPLAEQVQQSMRQSLLNLRVDYVDGLLVS
jgi:hypothetical protein